MTTTEERLLSEVQALREKVEQATKPPEPRHIPCNGHVVGVDVKAIAEGRVIIDMPEVKPLVTVDQAALNANITKLATGEVTLAELEKKA